MGCITVLTAGQQYRRDAGKHASPIACEIVGTPSEEAPGDDDPLVVRTTRIEAFSVGAFAIAISLLVLEVLSGIGHPQGSDTAPDADGPKDLTIFFLHTLWVMLFGAPSIRLVERPRRENKGAPTMTELIDSIGPDRFMDEIETRA